MNPISRSELSVEALLREVLGQNESIQRELNRLQSRFGRVTHQLEGCNQRVGFLSNAMLRSSSYLEQRIAELEGNMHSMTQEITRLAEADRVLEEEVSRLRAYIEAIANDSGHVTIHEVFRVVNRNGLALGQ